MIHWFHLGSKETTRKRHVTIDGKEVINYENIDWIVKHPKNLVSSGSVRAQKSKYVSIPMLHTSDWNLPPRMQEQILRFHQETNSMVCFIFNTHCTKEVKTLTSLTFFRLEYSTRKGCHVLTTFQHQYSLSGT